MRIGLPLACCLMLALLAAPVAGAVYIQEDPYVLLDAAKMKVGAGKLERGLKLLREIPSDSGEAPVDQEILYQQMLLSSAFLGATHFLLAEVHAMDYGDSAYAEWLSAKREAYAKEFHGYCQVFLEKTKDGSSLEFVRFRLPKVTDDYLLDAELYSDSQVLEAACHNWDDGREGLGRGVIIAQARVALVMSAAVHYDLPEPSLTLEGVAGRLRVGVPIDAVALLEWISSTADAFAPGGGALDELAEVANQRALELTAQQPARLVSKVARKPSTENKQGDTTSN